MTEPEMPLEQDPGFLAHAARSAERRADLRAALAETRKRISASLVEMGELDEIDCGGDCCLGCVERLTVIRFLEDAERSALAARALLHMETS